MEVHAHTHMESLPAGRAGKKFTHYLWEFLMLFLAVFAGFLAENIREDYVEQQRLLWFIKQLISGLERDTAQQDGMIDVLEFKERSSDQKEFHLN